MLPFEITLGCNLRERLSAWLYLEIKMEIKILICPKPFSGAFDGMRSQVMGRTRVPWEAGPRAPRAGEPMKSVHFLVHTQPTGCPGVFTPGSFSKMGCCSLCSGIVANDF